MSLAQRLNPDNEALLLAVGNRVYCYAYNRLQPFGIERPGKITSLAVHHSRVIDGGNYPGVRDTLENIVILGKDHHWNTLAVQQNNVYGSVKTENPLLFGIWDIQNMQRVRERNGQTTILIGGKYLVDQGEYTIRAECYPATMDPNLTGREDYGLYFEKSRSEEIILEPDSLFSKLSAACTGRTSSIIMIKEEVILEKDLDIDIDFLYYKTEWIGRVPREMLVTSMTRFERDIVLGTKDGKLFVIENYERKKTEAYSHHQAKGKMYTPFKQRAHPPTITALLSVPIEVYEDGIKQRIIQGIQRRVAYAKGFKQSQRKHKAA